MENEQKYEIKVTLRDGSYYRYKAKYDWDVHDEKLNDTRYQFYEFDGGRLIVARESILKVEMKEIESNNENGDE